MNDADELASERTYELTTVYGLFRDGDERDRLLFHVQTGDYFALLATVCGFAEEALRAKQNGEACNEETLRTLGRIRDDLTYLNAHYRIEPKEAAE